MVLRQREQSAMTLYRSYDLLRGSRRNILLQRTGACRKRLRSIAPINGVADNKWKKWSKMA
jgi:hypothetical protein